MNGFLIRKQDDSQIPTIHFIDLGPAANSTVLLYHFANRMFDCLENPLFPDYGSIRSRAHRQEVGAEFHWHDIAKGYHPLQPNPANVAALGLYRDGKNRLGGRAYQETGTVSAGTSASVLFLTLLYIWLFCS
jgi:hypothetical protein